MDEADCHYSPLGLSTPPIVRLSTPGNIMTFSVPQTPPKSFLLLPPHQLQASTPDSSLRRNIWSTPESSHNSISQQAGNVSMLTFSKLAQNTSDMLLLSQCDAFINICKCFTGASLFAIPWAFKQSGMLLGAVTFLILAFMTYYTLYWLSKCGHMHPTMNRPTYPDIAYVAFGSIGFYISWIAIVCMTIGVCSSYLVFIGSQLSGLLQSNIFNQNKIIFIVGVPMMLLSFLRSYRFLVPFNMLGLISLILAVIIILIESTLNINNINNISHDYHYNPDVTVYPLYLGNVAFAFLIHSVILPIEENMRDRTNGIVSMDFTKALNYAIVFVTVLFLLFAEYTYFAFGSTVCGNIMDNLDGDKWYTKLVIISLCINLFFTYPLFLFPMVECMEVCVFKINPDEIHENNNRRIEMQRNVLRICLVLITCAISVVVPDFEKLTGLTGAFGNNVLGLILPPIMYFKLGTLHNTQIKWMEKSIGYFCSAFGIAMLIICTYTFVHSIIFDTTSSCGK